MRGGAALRRCAYVVAALAAVAAAVVVSRGPGAQPAKVATELSFDGPNFSALQFARDVRCRVAGEHAGQTTYRCAWTAADTGAQSAVWVLDEGAVSRVSGGGEASHPPADAAAASRIVSIVARRRARGVKVACQPSGPAVGSTTPDFYSCQVQSTAPPASGQQIWSWEPDGTVGEQVGG